MGNNLNKSPLTIVKKDDIFKYLESLRNQGIKIYILDFDNFDDFIVERKLGFSKKGIEFDCIVFGKMTYTNSIIEDDYVVLTNEEFRLSLEGNSNNEI